MLWSAFIFCFLFLCDITSVCEANRRHGDGDFGSQLVTKMKDDVNLDLPVDEEYEDLRAELLAYHSALASLASGVSGTSGRKAGTRKAETRKSENRRSAGRFQEPRRSMKDTACWKLHGVCVDVRLCKGEQFLSEVPGCKNKLEVCCFAWNKYRLRFTDMHKIGIPNAYYPWKDVSVIAFRGKGLVPIDPQAKKHEKKHLYSKLSALNPEFSDINEDIQISRSKSSAPTAVAVVLRQIF